MSPEQNPYQVPQADVALLPEGTFHEPRGVPSGNGTRWLTDAYELFKISPGVWIAMFLVYGVCHVLVSFIPFAGTLFTPVFMAGFYQAAKSASEDNTVRLEDLFAGFRERLGPLVLVGLISLALTLGLAVVAVILGGVGMAMTGAVLDNGMNPAALGLILIGALLVAALFMPILMMTWFAPALVAFQGMPPFEAMKTSFNACMKNMMPFTLYGILGLGLLVAGLLALGVGLLVVLPILLISFYTSYHDIFIAND